MPCCGHTRVRFRRQVAKRAGQIKADERLALIMATPDALLSTESLRLKRKQEKVLAVQHHRKIAAELKMASQQLSGKIPPATDPR